MSCTLALTIGVFVCFAAVKAQSEPTPSGVYLPPKLEGPNGSMIMNPVENSSDYNFLGLPHGSTDSTALVNETVSKKIGECKSLGDVVNSAEWKPSNSTKYIYSIIPFSESKDETKRVTTRKACENEVLEKGESENCHLLEWHNSINGPLLNLYSYEGCSAKISTYECTHAEEQQLKLECKYEGYTSTILGLKTDGESWLLFSECQLNGPQKLSLLLRSDRVEMLQAIKSQLVDYIGSIGFEFGYQIIENIQACQSIFALN